MHQALKFSSILQFFCVEQTKRLKQDIGKIHSPRSYNNRMLYL